MWINARTEYSFLKVFGHIDKVAEKLASMADYGGIADFGNTFGHVKWEAVCKKHKIKPIYGVQLPVVVSLDVETETVIKINKAGKRVEKVQKIRRYPYNWMTFIAMNQHGLQAIYALVRKSFDQFYYRQRVTYKQINSLFDDDVLVLSGFACKWGSLKRTVYQDLTPATPLDSIEDNIVQVAGIDNYYINQNDKAIYEPFAAERQLERKTTLMHVPDAKGWQLNVKYKSKKPALKWLKEFAGHCNVELPKAPMVQYIGTDKIESWCIDGMKKRGLLTIPEYRDRFHREMKLIRKKNYEDYFLIVADIIRYAKKIMTVGPARGSSAGSLVCYLMGITEVDPIKYGLYFERFIDINREDLPDIDIDFQDNKRHLILEYATNKYGVENVSQIANITKFKPKLALKHFARNLEIPSYVVEEIKNIIPERPSGDPRAEKCIADTFEKNTIGQDFIRKNPVMANVAKIEGHSAYAGKHAAGILICPDPITHYASVDTHPSKDEKVKCLAMIDKRDAEKINLLKIDALGLREMTVIAEVCDQLDKPYTWIYSGIPLDDPKVFETFNDHRYQGIFQFEGKAVQGLAKQVYIKSIEDLSALTALGRPGPMGSGGAQKYIKNRKSDKLCDVGKFIDLHPLIQKALNETYGVIVYQEQVMRIMRELGLMSWKDVSKGRKIISKSVGTEAFDRLYDLFVKGCLKNSLTEDRALNIWKHLKTMSNYAFNKSHAVSYSILSYICAYLKTYHPLEFTLACLNNAKDDSSAVKILRDATEKEGIKYQYYCPSSSLGRWSIQEGVLIGGLLSIDGIGPAAAKKIVKSRRECEPYPKGITEKLRVMNTPFRHLYPATEIYGEYYKILIGMGLGRNAIPIKLLPAEEKNCKIIGCLIKKKIRDLNEPDLVKKRNGEIIKGNTTYINIILEDDTADIMCQIKAVDYQRLGRQIAESGSVDKDWYLVSGKRLKGFNLIFVYNIMKITEKVENE